MAKLAKLENGEADKSSTSKIMPPPNPIAQNNKTNDSIMISSSLNSEKQSQHLRFNTTNSPKKSIRRRRNLDNYDTSDSEVDAGSPGRSLLPANPYIASSSPKSNETSLMNVSKQTSYSIVDANADQNSYSSSPGILTVFFRKCVKYFLFYFNSCLNLNRDQKSYQQTIRKNNY